MDLPGITEVTDARLGAWRSGDAWLAGGTWLFSEPQPDLTRLLDLRAFGWPSLRQSQDGLEIAATCTLAELARLRAPYWRAAPLIGQCCAALLGAARRADDLPDLCPGGRVHDLASGWYRAPRSGRGFRHRPR
jgi:hypothetical protein